MSPLILGACIVLEGFTWRVSSVQPDYVVLTYPIVYRVDVNGKTAEKTEGDTMTWKRAYVEKNARRCKE